VEGAGTNIFRRIGEVMKQFLLCTTCLTLTTICAVFFGVQYLNQYEWEKKLSSIESHLNELSSIFNERKLAQQAAQRINPSFLQNALSQIHLLNIERGSLELKERRKGLTEEEKRRLRFITEENFLVFRSHKKIASDIEEKLTHTVQIDENDLPKILKQLEGSPELPIRIKRMHIERRPSSSNYNLYLELWRKES
jgi:hypothetical protein